MNSVIKFISVYVCTIIGASFITGNEVFLFFARFGNNGYLLVALCFVLFVTCSLIIFYKCKQAKVINLLDCFNGRDKHIFLKKLMQCFTYATYFMFASIMLAGLKELFGLCFTLVSGCICFFLIKKDITSIIKINGFLFPLVVLYLILLLFISTSGQGVEYVQKIDIFSVMGIFTYVSLNVILIFGSMLKLTNNMSKGQIVVAIVCSGLVFALLIVFQIFILSHSYITNFSMPLMEIASKNTYVYLFAVLVAYLAMLSSFLSSAYSLYAKIQETKQGNFYLALLVLAMLICSFLGFAVIVQLSYIVLGIISLILVIYLCFARISGRND